ncbi:hypothetical protein, partial [Staphylococcus aureus]
MSKEKKSFKDQSLTKVFSAATTCIPILEKDESSSALMDVNTQRQARPLMYRKSPFFETGMK